MTEVVLNSKEEQYFEIEAKLTNLAKNKNTYTIAVLDCCRKELKAEKPETKTAETNTDRGNGYSENTVKLDGQIKFIYGSQPMKGVAKVSLLSEEILREVRKNVEVKAAFTDL